MRGLITFSVLLGTCFVAFGQVNNGDASLKACEKISHKGKRATCFENLARQLSQNNDAKMEQERETGERVKKLQDYIASNFKDPGSAQFTKLTIGQDKYVNGLYHLCGEVNAKNSYGGYAGFQRFIAGLDSNGKMNKILENDKSLSMGNEQMEAMVAEIFNGEWKHYCEGTEAKTVSLN